MNKSKNIKLIIGSLVFLIFSATIIVLIIFVFTKNNNEFTNIFNNNIALKGNKDTSSTQYKFWDGQKDDNQSNGKLTFKQLDHPVLMQYYTENGYGIITTIKQYLGNDYINHAFKNITYSNKSDTFKGNIDLIYCIGYAAKQDVKPPVFAIIYESGTLTDSSNKKTTVKIISLATSDIMKIISPTYKFKAGIAVNADDLTTQNVNKNPFGDYDGAGRNDYQKIVNYFNLLLSEYLYFQYLDKNYEVNQMKISEISFIHANFVIIIPFKNKIENNIPKEIKLSSLGISVANFSDKFNKKFADDGFKWHEDSKPSETTLTNDQDFTAGNKNLVIENFENPNETITGENNLLTWSTKVKNADGYNTIKYINGYIRNTTANSIGIGNFDYTFKQGAEQTRFQPYQNNFIKNNGNGDKFGLFNDEHNYIATYIAEDPGKGLDNFEIVYNSSTKIIQILLWIEYGDNKHSATFSSDF